MLDRFLVIIIYYMYMYNMYVCDTQEVYRKVTRYTLYMLLCIVLCL